MESNILAQIKNLPPLPKSVIEVQKITSDPNSSIKDLVNVIKDDPMITANLLKAANSPLYGFTRQIKTVDQAVSLFGMNTVKGFVISFAIRNTLKFDLSAYGISESDFHDVSNIRNAIAINWYKLQREKLDIIATDSFLIDLGAVVISLYLVSKGKAEEFRNKLTPQNRYELEKEYVGYTTPQITAEIFRHWHFADELITPIENIDNPSDEYSKVLDVLRTLVDLLDKDNEENIQKGIQKAEDYGLDVESLKVAINLVKG